MNDDAIQILRLLYLQQVGIPKRCANQIEFYAEILDWPKERVQAAFEYATQAGMTTGGDAHADPTP